MSDFLSFVTGMTVAMLLLKLTEAANLTWWVIFSPLALPVLGVVGLVVVASTILVIGSIYNEKGDE